MSTFWKSWKTSLLGIASGALNLASQGTNWKSIAFSSALTLFGLFAKDHNVTGGTTTSEN